MEDVKQDIIMIHLLQVVQLVVPGISRPELKIRREVLDWSAYHASARSSLLKA